MKNENRLIVADVGWAETIPQWLKDEIASERMINGMINIITKEKDSFSDAEMVVYLMTASNRAPLPHNLTEIYLYLTGKLLIKHKGLTKETLPDFMMEISKKGLTEDQERELKDLRSQLLNTRGKVNHPLFDVLTQLKGGNKKYGNILKNSKK